MPHPYTPSTQEPGGLPQVQGHSGCHNKFYDPELHSEKKGEKAGQSTDVHALKSECQRKNTIREDLELNLLSNKR